MMNSISTEWLSRESIGYLSKCLEACESSQMLADLRAFVPREALREASKRLSVNSRRRIRAWVELLNQGEVAA